MRIPKSSQEGRRCSQDTVCVQSVFEVEVITEGAYRGVSCWSVYVCRERKRVESRRSTGILTAAVYVKLSREECSH